MTTTTLPGVAGPLALLTFPEVADLLRVSHMTIRRLVERGVLPCYHIARRVRFRARDVEAYLASRRTGGTTDHPYGGPQDT